MLKGFTVKVMSMENGERTWEGWSSELGDLEGAEDALHLVVSTELPTTR